MAFPRIQVDEVAEAVIDAYCRYELTERRLAELTVVNAAYAVRQFLAWRAETGRGPIENSWSRSSWKSSFFKMPVGFSGDRSVPGSGSCAPLPGSSSQPVSPPGICRRRCLRWPAPVSMGCPRRWTRRWSPPCWTPAIGNVGSDGGTSPS